MRINIDPPNMRNAKDTRRAVKLLEEWCRDTAEKLNIMLASIGEDNLDSKLREKFNGVTGNGFKK